MSIKGLFRRSLCNLHKATAIICIACIVFFGVINAFCAIDGEVYRKIIKPNAYIGAFFSIILFLAYYALLGFALSLVISGSYCEKLKIILFISLLCVLNFVWISLVFSYSRFFFGFLIKCAEFAISVLLASIFKPYDKFMLCIFSLCAVWLVYWVYISFSFLLLN